MRKLFTVPESIRRYRQVRPSGQVNCYEVTGIRSCLLTFRNGYKPLPGIWNGQSYVGTGVLGTGEVFDECPFDPGYVILHCRYYGDAYTSGQVQFVRDGLFIFERQGTGAVRFASGTGGYESSIELGFQIIWDPLQECFSSRKLVFEEALAVVDRHYVAGWDPVKTAQPLRLVS